MRIGQEQAAALEKRTKVANWSPLHVEILKTKQKIYKDITRFWVKVLGTGVAIGIVPVFEFYTNSIFISSSTDKLLEHHHTFLLAHHLS